MLMLNKSYYEIISQPIGEADRNSDRILQEFHCSRAHVNTRI